MAVDFESKEFKKLPKAEKARIVKEEFRKCREDIQYYLQNYAYIRHPNAGIIKFKPFDFQLDVVVPISISLKKGRTPEAIEEIKKYKLHFDYKKWMQKIIEQNIEMLKTKPYEFHHFYRHTVKHPEWPTKIDTIVLKSRQTGISTVFQHLNIWHINFYPSVYHIIVSQRDKEAKEYLKHAYTSWQLIPAPLRAKKMGSNVHELWVSLTGEAEHRSGMHAFPPTPDAGRSYSPNLIVMDEAAMYRNADEVYTALSMATAGGGVMVIISTPKGVGNLFHRLWVAAKDSFSVHVKKSTLKNEISSAFRPMVIHWSQLPDEEFKRRGFDSSIEWYNHMKAKLAQKGGEKAVAQELDLDFLTSGDTYDIKILNKLKENAIEMKGLPTKVLSNGVVVVYPPIQNVKYIIGIDSSEGIGEDYQFFHVARADNGQIVAYFADNTVDITRYTEIIRQTGLLYNGAYLMIERNNHGQVILSRMLESTNGGEPLYPPHLIFNRYDVTKFKFIKHYKGWQTSNTSRQYLITSLFSWLNEMADEVNLPIITADEFFTFVNIGGKWQAQRGFHDDGIISLALTVMGIKLLPQYENFLAETGESAPTRKELSPEFVLISSDLSIKMEKKGGKEEAEEKIALDIDLDEGTKTLVDELKKELKPKERERLLTKDDVERNLDIIQAKRLLLSKEQEIEEDDIYVF